MDKKLALVLQFGAIDKLTGPLKNIIGLGKSGAPSLKALQREAGSLKTELNQLNAQMQRGEGSIMDMAAKQMTLQRRLDATTTEIDQQKRALGEYHARQKQITAFRDKMGGIADKAGMVGAGASVLVSAPLIAFGSAAIQASREASKAMAQTRASLASMGNTANRTFPQLQAQAEALMKTSLFDDDEILNSVTANMLTFGKVSGKVFDRAQQAVIDYSSKTGKDLQGATIMVGKALNDPIKGLTALSKVGVQFTDGQKAMIQTMMKTGDVAGAQSVILKELEKQYGGSGKAARAADPTGAAAIDWGELQQAVGDKLLPQLVPLVGVFSQLLASFNQLSPETQGFIIKLGVAAALFGPLMLGVAGLASGLGALAPALPLVKAGFATLSASGPMLASMFDLIKNSFLGVARVLLTNPFMLLAMGIAVAAYLIYSNWGTIKATFNAGMAWLGALGTRFKQFGLDMMRGLVNGITSGIGWVKNTITGLVAKVKGWFANPMQIRSPSRLFMGYGGFLTQGLAMGIDKGAAAPKRSMNALAAGLAGASLLTSPAMGATGGAGAGGMAGGARASAAALAINITINAAAGQDAEEIARVVIRKIEQAQRQAQLSSYRDD